MAAFEDRTSPDLDQFKGSRWTEWLSAIQSSEPKQQSMEGCSKRDVEVARLRRTDMGLFGYRPAIDKFFLVVCEHCGKRVKPQSLNMHYERKHKSKRITRLSGTSNPVRSTYGHGKHAIDRSNHRMLSPPHGLKHRHGVASLQKTSLHSTRRTSMNERENSKSEPILEKIAAAANERERLYVESAAAKNHRSEKPGTRLIAPQPAKSRNSHDNATAHIRPHHSKLVHKPGGTIQLNEIPESHVVKTTPHHSGESGLKHHHRPHRVSSSKEGDVGHGGDHKWTEKGATDPHAPGSKSRKNHDGYHHHYHQTRQDSLSDNDTLSPENLKLRSPGGEQRLSGGIPRVILEKTTVPGLAGPSGSVKVGHYTHKRSRPHSGSSESSISPPRHKIPTLRNPVGDKGPPVPPKPTQKVPNSTLPSKVKKKEKRFLPLKAREYDPNKHCGVWVKDENAHCRRSLTCKVHPLSAKRAVTGRRKQFDELVQEHGREKQRLKEKAAAAQAVSATQASGRTVTSPPAVQTPTEFVVPSPALAKPTPFSPPACVATTPSSNSQSTVPTTPKLKSSISLFPRIFAAWHVDCWEDEDVTDDFSPKSQSYMCLHRHPHPLTFSDYPARRSSSCQISYSRKVERQLEALSSNFQKFGSKMQKTPKPFSFTPISPMSYNPAPPDTKNSVPPSPLLSQVPQRTGASKLLSKQCIEVGYWNAFPVTIPQSTSGVLQISNDASTARVQKSQRNSKNKPSRKFSNMAPLDGGGVQAKSTLSDASLRKRSKSEQITNLLRRAGNGGNVSARVPSHQSELQSTSPHIFLNETSQETMPSSMQTSLSANATLKTANTPSNSVRSLTPANEELNHIPACSPKIKSMSAIQNYPISQPHAEPLHAEHVDGNPLMIQLPNGLMNSILKPGTHSVTLSGNIGALTVTGEDSNFAGNQNSKRLKNMNSNNNFLLPNNTISSSSEKTKHFGQIQHDPVAVAQNQALGGAAGESFFLSNDEHFLTNQQNPEGLLNTVNLQPYSNQNFAETMTLEQQPQSHSSNSSSTEIITMLHGSSENCDTLHAKLDKHSIQLVNQLEQAYATPSAPIHNRRYVDATQGHGAANSARTTDLSQTFVTQ